MRAEQMRNAELVSENDVWAARRYLYGLAWFALGGEPTGETIEALASDLAEKAVRLVSSDGQLEESYGRIRTECASLLCAESSSRMAGVKGQYVKAFIGPGKLAAYPWESMYVEAVPGLFQDSTMAVRRAYAAQGMRPVCLNAEPDDHVATELHFMMKMSERSMGTEFESLDLLDAQASFLGDHLMRWLPLYVTKLRESGIASFYVMVLQFVESFIVCDKAFLDGHVTSRSVEC